eukprot:Hpha_TRINITY_DN15204_c8_g7::TRINITY_DN15204_c8_g7_i1::g.67451::m.67451
MGIREFCFCGWLIREGDTVTEARIKTTLFPFISIVLTLCSVWTVKEIEVPVFQIIGTSTLLLASVLFLVGVATNLVRVGYLVDMFLFLGFLAVWALDIADVSTLSPYRTWVVAILGMDIALVFQRDHVLHFAIPGTLLYLAAQGVEGGKKFGLSQAWGASEEDHACNCASPPCEDAMASLFGTILICFVYLSDFYLTRSFATGMRIQLRRISNSVEVVAKVAAALAKYDVQEAEKVINEGGDLPEELLDSFWQLLFNLTSYREYLPEALLQNDDNTDTGVVPPPLGNGEDEVKVAVVFTDIQSSTALWEADPVGMYEALQVHNKTLRKTSKERSGYEVKIIGDALMLAFSDAKNAVLFGVEAQLDLVQSEWPLELCEQPLCRYVAGPDGTPRWHGVRVRIGINWGPVEAEKNPITGRYDYFGGTVNTASRVEAALQHGGLSGVSQAVVDEVGTDFMNELYTVKLPEKVLKGVSKPVTIYVILPPVLAPRWAELQAPKSPDSNSSDPPRGGVGGRQKRWFQRRSVVSSHRTSLSSSQVPVLNLRRMSVESFDMGCDRLSLTSEEGMSPIKENATLACTSSGNLLGPKGPPPPSGILQLGLSFSNAACATVTGAFQHVGMREAETVMTQLVVAVETAALRTQGQVACVMSAMCCTGWNAGKGCPEYIAQSARFVTLIPDNLEAHLGLASGGVLAGNISGTRRRHVTVAGKCVEFSMELAQTAVTRDLRFMVAGQIGTRLGKDGLASKLAVWQDVKAGEEVDVWGPDRGTEVKVEAEERKFAASFPTWSGGQTKLGWLTISRVVAQKQNANSPRSDRGPASPVAREEASPGAVNPLSTFAALRTGTSATASGLSSTAQRQTRLVSLESLDLPSESTS